MSRIDFIKSLLEQTGYIVLNNEDKTSNFHLDVGYKSHIDFKANEFISNELHKNFPNDLILSEENFFNRELEISKEKYLWVTDPLCGTTNYLHGIPFFSIALSLVLGNKILASGIYDPNRKELFFSENKYSFLNKEKIFLKKNVRLSDALVCINCNQSDIQNKKYNLLNLVKLFSPPVSRRIHILESANLELAYVACGRIDAYINPTDNIWDFISSLNLVTNAGGCINTIQNFGEGFLNKRGIIAANNEKLFNEIKIIFDSFNNEAKE